MDAFVHELALVFGGATGVVIYAIGFLFTFITALGRGFLMRKPPLCSQRFVDALLCAMMAIPITGVTLEEQGLSVWWVWVNDLCFGALGFMVFYEFLRDFVPDLKRIFISRMTK